MLSEKRNTKNVLAAVVHDVLNVEHFTTLADLAEVVKCRAACLRIPYDAGRVSEAFALVAHTRPLLRPSGFSSTPVEAKPEGPAGDAGQVLERIYAGVLQYRQGKCA